MRWTRRGLAELRRDLAHRVHRGLVVLVDVYHSRLVIGAWRDRELVAYGVLQLDLPPSEDARPLLGLAPHEPLAKLAGASVVPELWGAGLDE